MSQATQLILLKAILIAAWESEFVEFSNDGQKWSQICDQKSCEKLKVSNLVAVFDVITNELSCYLRFSKAAEPGGTNALYNILFCFVFLWSYIYNRILFDQFESTFIKKCIWSYINFAYQRVFVFIGRNRSIWAWNNCESIV